MHVAGMLLGCLMLAPVPDGHNVRPPESAAIVAEYDAGVLRLSIPVSEQAKPHKIEIAHNGHRKAIKS